MALKLKLLCIKCGGHATEGVESHPLCEKCYRFAFNGDWEEFESKTREFDEY